MKKIVLLISSICFATILNAQITSKTVNVIKPGTLGSFLSNNERNTITNLTVTGNIDARDFTTMRDSMPYLNVIDLSSTIIAEYYDDLGLGTSEMKFYNANLLPKYCLSGKTLSTLLLPTSIDSISNQAFPSLNLKSIVIPSKVKKFDDFTFAGSHIDSIQFAAPTSLEYIGKQVFSYSTLMHFSLPSSVKTLSKSFLCK